MRRDQTRPSVIAWSLANEPDTDPTREPGARAYFGELLAFARTLDPQRRPITVEHHSYADPAELAGLGLDMVGVHHYPGWYDGAPVGRVSGVMGDFLRRWAAQWRTPIVLGEYGAGALAGRHEWPAQLYSEERQLQLLEADHAAIDEARGRRTRAQLLHEDAATVS